MSEWKEFLPEGVKVLIASAAAYLGAYLYQTGYANYLNIPMEFVSVSLSNLLVFGAIMISVVVLLYHILCLFIKIHDDHGGLIKKSPFGLFLKKWTPALAIAALFWVFSGHQLEDIKNYYLLIFLVSADLVVPIFRAKGVPYSDSLRGWIVFQSGEDKGDCESFMSSPESKKWFTYLTLLVLVSTFCLAIGRGHARRREEFGFVGDQAIVACYDNQLVLCKYDLKTERFTRNFQLVEIKNLNQNIEVKKIKRVK